MDINIELVLAPISESLLTELGRVFSLAFGQKNNDYIRWRLDHMPDVTVFAARNKGLLVGFKAGYAFTESRYCSWLGCVDPDFRRQRIAIKLMLQQHQWLRSSDYSFVETHVLQSNEAMVKLNHDAGLVITGSFMKQGEPNFVMQKSME